MAADLQRPRNTGDTGFPGFTLNQTSKKLEMIGNVTNSTFTQ